MINPFHFSSTPEIHFGVGKFGQLALILKRYGKRILLITGQSSFRVSNSYIVLLNLLKQTEIQVDEYWIAGEPSPEVIDKCVQEHRKNEIDAVVAVGGGSVLDAGKAISAMLSLPDDDSVYEYLEGVGQKVHPGTKVPFIACPTTSGTGSENTKNAVISRLGEGGFKKSLRHDSFVPNVAIVDPELTLTCPADVTASCGMDALTQLLESYVSIESNPMTDALAESGFRSIRKHLLRSYTDGQSDIKARTGMAYAAMISGITLANAGLGVIHGMASSAGGFFPVPHGVFCGTVLGEVTKLIVERLLASPKKNRAALKKYSHVGEILSFRSVTDFEQGCRLLVEILFQLTDEMKLPLLSQYGIDEFAAARISQESGNKNNPIVLTPDEMEMILKKRI